ncbi:pilus assembly protein TadG-related protein [Lacrimispora sp.]|uniref:TadE/TadG family type IV pilus assembly protein n=1 Tax=Lacrimispora sp. TaxID=2719234 RepID=UPI0032E4D142
MKCKTRWKKKLACFDREDGNILLLFAGCLTVLIFFIGISMDLGLIYLKRNALMNLCQLVKEDRFTFQDSIRYSDNPGKDSFTMIEDALRRNHFDGTVKVYFKEDAPETNYRYYKIRTQLSEEYSYTFLKIFGADTTTITVYFDGGETYGEGISDVIWHPALPVSSYNGSYTSQPDGSFGYDSADIPADW